MGIDSKYNIKIGNFKKGKNNLITDIYGANRLDITSILVNPLTEKDYSMTLINRMLEKIIYGSLEKKELFLRGKYYE